MKTLNSMVDRIGQADLELWMDWHRSVQELSGNPYGVEIVSFPKAVGMLVQSVPLPYYNRLMPAASGAWSVDEAVAFYHGRFMPFRVDLNPYFADEALLEQLTGCGFQPIGLQTNLFARPVPLPSSCLKGIRIAEVAPREAVGFAAVYDRAYYGETQPGRLTAFRRAATVARVGRAGWRFWGAYIDDELVGGAGLFMHDGVATLGGAATMPAYRGRGVQACLLNHRLSIAGDLGCNLVVARCHVGSTSQRNLERAGLETAYTKIIFEHTWPRRARKESGPQSAIQLDDRVTVGTSA